MRTLALGAWLASRGALATVGFVLAGAGAVASVVAAHALAREGAQAAAQLPTLASKAVAWSAGMMFAFGASLRAVHHDRQQGIVALVRARGVTVREYVRGRVGGLVLLLAAVVGGPTLVAGLAAISAGVAERAVRSSVAALAYAVVFAMAIGPLTLASLGARSRAGGYLALLVVLVLPELVAPWTAALLPDGWHEVTSVPAALDALSAGVMSPAHAQAHTARALVLLACVALLSLLLVEARVEYAAREPEM